MGLSAVSASAAPFVTVNLLGRITGSGQPFSSSVSPAVGQTVDYAVQYILGPAGSTNPFASNQTVTAWVTSAPAPLTGDPPVDPTSGLGSLKFSIFETSGASPRLGVAAGSGGSAASQATNPDSATDLANGGDGTDGSWTKGTGSSNGVSTARGDGANDLIGATFIRAAGTFDGIDGSNQPVTVQINNSASTKSRLTVQTSGNGVVSIGTKGALGTDIIAGLRWRDGSGNAVNTTITKSQEDASVTAGNPIIVFNGLNVSVAPEPTSLALLGVAGLGLMRRRKA